MSPHGEAGDDRSRQDTARSGAVLPLEARIRKELPLCTGLLDYFPLALAAVANCSLRANRQHNGSQPMHWARGKSNDHADCIARHLIDRGTFDPVDGLRHSVKLAWRALALLQTELEAEGYPCGRASIPSKQEI
jgi:hypothetical protein